MIPLSLNQLIDSYNFPSLVQTVFSPPHDHDDREDDAEECEDGCVEDPALVQLDGLEGSDLQMIYHVLRLLKVEYSFPVTFSLLTLSSSVVSSPLVSLVAS